MPISNANVPLQSSDFDYKLPKHLIAQEALPERDQSRMMVLHRATGQIQHHRVGELPTFLNKSDVLVLNNTRVIRARVFGKKEKYGGKVEVLFIEELEKTRWKCMLRSSRWPKFGEVLLLGNKKVEKFIFVEALGNACCVLEACCDMHTFLEREGISPLPPYIQRKAREEDKERYQTVFAETAGAVAAPTAGLHFTPALLHEIKNMGVEIVKVTLHVGPGTFLPVKGEDLRHHTMHEEAFEITGKTASAIQEAKKQKKRIVCVGTTPVRALETVVQHYGKICACRGRTNIFIFPPFTFQATDALLSNFHLPRSTLIMLVSAFAGRKSILKAYQEAIREKYRFYSYGDCMLIV